jgi:hypothetical protein
MFQALIAHPQEALYKRHFVYCVRVMSVGCTRNEVEPSAACEAPPEGEKVMLETCKGP